MMRNGRCATCLVARIGTLRFFLHISNLMCAFACIQLIIFAVVNLLDVQELDVLLSDEFITSPHIVSLILSAFLLLNSLYGYSSVARQSPISMNCYTIMQLNIFIFCIITLLISDIKQSMADAFQYVWDNQNKDSEFVSIITQIQWKLGCCGMNNTHDYNDLNSTTNKLLSCPFTFDGTYRMVFEEVPCQNAVDDWALEIYVKFVSSLASTAVITFVTFILSYYYTSAIILKLFIEREQHVGLNDL